MISARKRSCGKVMFSEVFVHTQEGAVKGGCYKGGSMKGFCDGGPTMLGCCERGGLDEGDNVQEWWT